MTNRFWKICILTVLAAAMVCVCAFALADGVTLSPAEYNEDFVRVSDDGSTVTVKLNQWVDFAARAPGAGYIDFHALTEPYTATTVLDGRNEIGGDFTDRLGEEGRVDCHWIEVGYSENITRYIVARAHYFNDEGLETGTAVSNVITLNAEYDGPISEEVTFNVPADVNHQVGGVYQVARDGRLFVDVNNIEGVEFFGLYIDEDETTDENPWLADSHWFHMSEGETTRVPLTIPRCEVGEDYEVRVFAIKFGAEQKDAETTIPIHVTAAESDCPVILSMGNTFQTGEPLRVFAHYTNPENLEDIAMVIRIYEKDNPDNEVYWERGDITDFWDEGANIWQSGIYEISAYIYQYGMQIRAYEGIKEIEITAEGRTVAPQTEPIATLTEGEDLTLNLHAEASGDEVMPEWFDYALFRLDWGFAFEDAGSAEMDGNGDGTIVVDKGHFMAGGQYLIRLMSMRTGYDLGVTEMRFVVTSPEIEGQNLTLYVNGSTEAEQTVYSSSNVHVKVEFDEKPTMVRVTNGGNWDYWWGEDEDFERDWGYGDDEMIMYAEASWDDIDLNKVDWNTFNWNRDLHWTGASNTIKLNVVSPYGEMKAPDFTIDNPQTAPGGVIPWGEDLLISVSDKGPTHTDGHIVEDGWFYCNIEVERINEYGDPYWERVNHDWGYDILSGVNRIPTLNLEDNCKYQIEIGADGEGYSGRSRWIEFTLGEREETEENPISYFTVNGGTVDIEIETYTNIQLVAYQTGAEWYGVDITKEGDEGWGDRRDDCRSGILMDNWRTDSEGCFTLTAYAYRHLPEGQTDEDGNDFSSTEIGTITVTANAPHGDLGEMNVSMADKVYMGDPLEIIFDEVPNAEEYSYFVHDEYENRWITGDSRRDAGSLTIDTNGLRPGVYWVETDAMAKGYNQAHGTIHFALIESEEKDYSDPNGGYYFSISAQSVPTDTDAVMVAYIPGAEEIELSYMEKDGDEMWVQDRRNGPGLTTYFSRGNAGTFEIYLSGRQGDHWGEPIHVCTLTITAEHVFEGDPAVTVNGSEEGNTVPADNKNPQKLTIEVARDAATEGYHIQLEQVGDGWPIFNWFTDLNSDEDDDRITIEDDKITYVIEDERIMPGIVYKIGCYAHAPNYECSGTERTFLLEKEGMTENLTITANGQSDGSMDILSCANIHVKVQYNTQTRPTALRVQNGDHREYWWGEDNFERDWSYGDGTVYLYAEATWDDIDFEALEQSGWNEFDWDRDVNWTGKSKLIQVNIINPYGEMKAPDFTIDNPLTAPGGVIPWGDDLMINIEDAGPTDREGNIVEGGWFFLNIEVERYDENGGSWWENLNNYGYSVHGGINHIPTNNLEGNCRYRIHIGADARGYSGRSRETEFRLGGEPEGHDIRCFKVNGSTEHEFSADTYEEIEVMVYRSGAEWYRVEIRKQNEDGWYNELNDRGNGVLYETWKTNQEGTYELMAIACGHLRDENGEIITDEEGRDFWEDPIARATIHVAAPNGRLADPWVDVPMTVNAGEEIRMTWHLDGAAEEYSCWISYEDDGWNLYGDSKHIAEIRKEIGNEADTYDMVIPAGALEANRVYHVYLDTMATGYNQGHEDRTLYVLGEAETDGSITIEGPEELAFSDYFPIAVCADGADEIQVWWEAAGGWRWSEGGYAVQYYCQDWVPGPGQYYEDENGQKYIRFYAFARFGSELKVSRTLCIPYSTENVENAAAPGLSIGNSGTIYRGDFIEAVVTAIDDPDVMEYKAFITDEGGGWVDFTSSETAGTLLLPTNYLETEREYYLQACAMVPGKIRTDCAPIPFTVSEATGIQFIVSKTEVEVCEPLTVSVVAPGAERIRFSGGYDNWWDDNGWEGDSWYSSDVRWEMSEDPDITIKAEAWYPKTEDWTPVGEAHIRVTARDSLRQPEIDIPATAAAGQDLNISISEVENAEAYRIEIRRVDGNGWWSFDADPGENMIPGWVLNEGGYRIQVIALAYGYNAGQKEQDLYVEPIRPEIRVNSVVSNTTTLSIKVPLVENGTEYELAIHYVPADDPNDFEASYVYRETLHDTNAVNGILTFTVPKNTLRNGMTHWIDCYVWGEDGFFCENAKTILVRNEQADGNITIFVNGEEGDTRVMIHDGYKVNVSAPGAKALYIRCGDDGRYYRGESVEDEFNEWQTYPETLYAQACYGNVPEGENIDWESLNWSEPSNPVVITFYAIGQVGQPGCYVPENVVRGDILVISDIYEGDYANETHANIYTGDPWSNGEGDWVYGDYWQGWDEGKRSIYLSTAMLEPGEYWVALDNSGIGYTGNRCWRRITVTEREGQQENDIILSIPAKAETRMNVPVSVYASGAVQVGYGIDLNEAEKQNPEKYEIRDGEICYDMYGPWFDEAGQHTITACAQFTENGAWTLTDQTIEICEPMRFDLSGMPGYFTVDQANASVTIPLPENAQRMSIQIDTNNNGNWERIYETREDQTADTTVLIAQQYLQAGTDIHVNFQAKADFFTDCNDGTVIPVTAAQGSMATLTLRTGDIENVWADEEIEFLVTPAAGKTLTAIRFYNGYGWWENGNAITPEEYSDWFDNGSAFFWNYYNDEPNRTLTAFAEVKVAGSDAWTRTNEMQFTVKNEGRVGRYDFEDLSEITVPRGKTIEVTFQEAEGAERYWADAFSTGDGRSWNPRTWNDEGTTTVRIGTASLEPGTYELWGRAGGTHKIWTESNNYVTLTITNETPAMPEATFRTPNALTTIEEEAFAGISAETVEIGENAESVRWQAFADSGVKTVIIRNGNTWIDDNAFDGCGNITVYGEPNSEVSSWAERNGYSFYPIP